MFKVHFTRKQRWYYVELDIIVFLILVRAEIISYTNCVFYIRQYLKDETPIIIPSPLPSRKLIIQDFKNEKDVPLNDEILNGAITFVQNNDIGKILSGIDESLKCKILKVLKSQNIVVSEC